MITKFMMIIVVPLNINSVIIVVMVHIWLDKLSSKSRDMVFTQGNLCE